MISFVNAIRFSSTSLRSTLAKSVENADDYYRFHQKKLFATLKIPVNQILNNSTHLQNGVFIGTRGISSKIYYGVKGTGKTTLFRLMAQFIPLKHPKIVPCYLSFHSHTSLSAGIKGELKSKGILDATFTGSISDIFEDLKKKGLFLLLLLDDLECLYQKPQDNMEALDSLRELAYLSGNDEGRASTFLCSSSLRILDVMELYSRSSAHDLKKFPLLNAGIPKMNLTKISPSEIPAILPNDIQALSDMYHGVYSMELVARTAFYTGCNLFSFKDMYKDHKFENIHPLKMHIYQELVKKNLDLLQRIGNHYPKNWYNELKPISPISIDDDAFVTCKENCEFITDRVQNIYPTTMIELYYFYKKFNMS